MSYENQKEKKLKIAYIGGGSRGWAWGLMSDLAQAPDIAGTVALYDIDKEAAKANEIIGNSIGKHYPEHANFQYVAVDTLEESLTGADFVIISILPGTFDEMESDVHAPEEYGIYQSVGDTSGPGGILRALRTIPMFEVIGEAIKTYCPKAWVINYTNPMTICVKILYRVFPEIKAFGCCHEVFGTQKFLAKILQEKGYGEIPREDIKVNVVGINHFTWLTEAKYKDIDIFPIYLEHCIDDSKKILQADDNWMNRYFASEERVKMDLFLRYGAIAAAGDRHLAEFCPGKWYLIGDNEKCVKTWGFALTPVSYRKNDLKERLEKSERLVSGETKFELKTTGEDGVKQIRALLGLEDLVTNVNLPNYGQIPNLPLGAVVETNAYFTTDSVKPVMAGEVPKNVNSLVAPIVTLQEMVVEAGIARDLDLAFQAFSRDPLMTIGREEAKELFDKMVANTAAYLGEYLGKE